MSVLNFLLKNLQGCCLLFNYQGSFSLLSSQRQLIYIITFTIACQQLFYFSFRCPLRSSLSFETAYLEYHFYRHLSTGNFIYFFAFPWALKHFPVLSHATACIIYHARPELSILFLLFILFAQFIQFIFPSESKISLFSQIRRGNLKKAPLPVSWDIAFLSVYYTFYYTLYLL